MPVLESYEPKEKFVFVAAVKGTRGPCTALTLDLARKRVACPDFAAKPILQRLADSDIRQCMSQ